MGRRAPWDVCAWHILPVSKGQDRLPSWLSGKESTCSETQETQVRSLGRVDPLEKDVATHSSILAGGCHRTHIRGARWVFTQPSLHPRLVVQTLPVVNTTVENVPLPTRQVILVIDMSYSQIYSLLSNTNKILKYTP